MKNSMRYITAAFGIFLAYVPNLAAQIPGAQTNAAPTAASLDGALYTAWMGKTLPIDTVWYYPSPADAQAPVTNALTSEAPALASNGSTLYLAWNKNGYINYMNNNGTGWVSGPPAYEGPDSYASGAPALAVSGSNLYVAWVEAGQIYVASYVDGVWTLLPPLPSGPNATSLGTAPALAVYNNTLFLAWLVAPQNVNYTTFSLSGTSWSTIATTPAITGVVPALGVYNYTSTLYLAWTDASGISYSEWNGAGWNPAVAVSLSAPIVQLAPALVSNSAIIAVCPNPVVNSTFSVVYASQPSSSAQYDDVYVQTLPGFSHTVGQCTCKGTACQ
jgi:hypothetical protein